MERDESRMLKKIDETRKKAEEMRERRDQNQKSYLDKIERNKLKQMEIEQKREEFRK